MFRNIFWLAAFSHPMERSMRYPATATLPPLFAVQRLADAQWLVRTRWATRFCPAPVKITGEYRALLCKRELDPTNATPRPISTNERGDPAPAEIAPHFCAAPAHGPRENSD